MDKYNPRPYQRVIAAILSLLLCGLGQLYLRRIFKGLALMLSCALAIAIIWVAISNTEFKVMNWDGKDLMFIPSQRNITIRGRVFNLTEIMKVSGSIQLALTWLFGIVDAARKGRSSRK